MSAVPPSTPESSTAGKQPALTTPVASPTSGKHRLPSKLQHAPGFQPSQVDLKGCLTNLKDVEMASAEGVGEGKTRSHSDVFVSVPFSDKTGFLCDFGMMPPSPVEKSQIDLFIE